MTRSDEAGAIDERVVSDHDPCQFSRSENAEIAAVHGHSSLRLWWQLRRSANERGDLVPCSQRLAKHVAPEGSCCAKEDETWHAASGSLWAIDDASNAA